MSRVFSLLKKWDKLMVCRTAYCKLKNCLLKICVVQKLFWFGLENKSKRMKNGKESKQDLYWSLNDSRCWVMLTRCLTNEIKNTKFHRETIQKLSPARMWALRAGLQKELGDCWKLRLSGCSAGATRAGFGNQISVVRFHSLRQAVRKPKWIGGCLQSNTSAVRFRLLTQLNCRFV